MNLDAERVGAEPQLTTTANTSVARLRSRFDALSIGGKITLFFSLNLVCALLAGAFVVGGYIELGKRAENIRSTHDHALQAERLLVQLSEAQRHGEMLVASGSTARARAARAALDKAATSRL